MRSRVLKGSGVAVLAAALFVVVVISVFVAGVHGVKSAESAARLPIPSTQRVHLDARGYTVSYAVYDSSSPGLDVPDLHVSITRAGTGEPVELRRPVKRYFSTAGNEKAVDEYLVTVPAAGVYDVSVTADEPTNGYLLIGNRPIDALHRIFLIWVALAVLGAVIAVLVAVLIHRRSFGISIAVRVNH